MLPGTLDSVDQHYSEMQRLELLSVSLLVRLWDRIDRGDIVGSWDAAIIAALPRFTQLQLAAAGEGASYTDAALREQNISSAPEAAVAPAALAGVASDGRSLASLLRVPLEVVGGRLDDGGSIEQALEMGRASVRRIAHTQIGDAARVAAGVDVATRTNIAWVRMLSGTSCSRCIELAGRAYRWSDGFDRHPQDDCIHVPTTVNLARYEVMTDPKKYFDSLSKTEQDRRFGKAGAEAIRDGADIGQVVNARRGMTTAGRDAFGNRVGRMARTPVFGQEIFTTLEGTTTRGLAGQRLLSSGARTVGREAEVVRRISRTGAVERVVTRQRVQTPRLMPESIYEIAEDRADALRLLRRFGYIL
jgi:hypothetical protein